MFFGEATMSQSGEDREWYEDLCFEQITPYGGSSIMFWAAIDSMDQTALKKIVAVEWEHIPQETIWNVLEHIIRRIQAMFLSRTGHTHY